MNDQWSRDLNRRQAWLAGLGVAILWFCLSFVALVICADRGSVLGAVVAIGNQVASGFVVIFFGLFKLIRKIK